MLYMELTYNNCKGRNFNTYYIDTLEEFAPQMIDICGCWVVMGACP